MGLHRRISALHSPQISGLPVTSSHPTKSIGPYPKWIALSHKRLSGTYGLLTPSGVSLSKVQALSQNLNYACTSITIYGVKSHSEDTSAFYLWSHYHRPYTAYLSRTILQCIIQQSIIQTVICLNAYSNNIQVRIMTKLWSLSWSSELPEIICTRI